VRDPQFKVAVQQFARDAGVSVSRLCAVVVRTELRERWIERAVSLPTQFESATEHKRDIVVGDRATGAER